MTKTTLAVAECYSFTLGFVSPHKSVLKFQRAEDKRTEVCSVYPSDATSTNNKFFVPVSLSPREAEHGRKRSFPEWRKMLAKAPDFTI